VDVTRNTFARVVTLLISLGYGILFKNLEKYLSKVLFLGFLYMASQSANMVLSHLNNNKPVSQSIKGISTLPNMILNFIFLFWTFLALKRTMNYLVSKE